MLWLFLLGWGADGLATWVVAVGLNHPMLQVTKNNPLEWALWLLLWLQLWFSLPLKAGSSNLDGVILIQTVRGLPGLLHQWMISGAETCVEAPAHFLPVGKVHPGQWLGFFCSMLEGFGISQGLLRLHHLIVLTAKSHVLDWQELIPVQRLGCWQHRVIILYFGGMAFCFWYL